MINFGGTIIVASLKNGIHMNKPFVECRFELQNFLLYENLMFACKLAIVNTLIFKFRASLRDITRKWNVKITIIL